MKVLLTRKLAGTLDGVDLSSHQVGDVFDLPPDEARLVIAEAWAIPERRTAQGRSPGPRRRADDHPGGAGDRLLHAS